MKATINNKKTENTPVALWDEGQVALWEKYEQELKKLTYDPDKPKHEKYKKVISAWPPGTDDSGPDDRDW